MKRKTIKLKQMDAHWCKIESDFGKKIIWDLLSFTKYVRLKWKPRPVIKKASVVDGRGWKFPFGLVDYVYEKLDEKGYDVDLETIGVKFETTKPILKGITFEPYQEDVLKRVKKHSRGIIEASTGAGKGPMAAGIISLYKRPVSVYITINKSIFNALYKDFCAWFPDETIGRIGEGICDVQQITVALYQSLSKFDLAEYSKILELVIWDECHVAGNSIEKIFSQLPNTHLRYGLTATMRIEKEDKEKYFQMIGGIGPKISNVSDKECEARVTDVEVYMLEYHCYHPIGTTYQKSFRNNILLSKERNKKLILSAKRMALDIGKTALILVDEIAQITELQKIAKEMNLPVEVVHGQTKKGHNEETKQKLEKGEINFVVGSGVWGTGTSIYNIDCVVLGSVRKSTIKIIQNIGRSRRRTKDKSCATIIDCYDEVHDTSERKFNTYFLNYSKKRKKLYEKKGWFKGFI